MPKLPVTSGKRFVQWTAYRLLAANAGLRADAILHREQPIVALMLHEELRTEWPLDQLVALVGSQLEILETEADFKRREYMAKHHP